jgi:hypothetical protein
MSLIITVCGRRFRCVPGGVAVQEISEEVRQHLQGPSGRIGNSPAEIMSALVVSGRNAIRCLGSTYVAMKLAATRAMLAARPVVQFTLGL